MSHATITIFVLLTSLMAVAPASEAATYRVEPEESNLFVRLYKAGFGKALAHDHVVRAGDVSGSLELDPDRPQSASIELVVPARSLRADEPADRRRFDLDPLDDDSREEIQGSMESDEQMDIASYPEIRFVSTKIEPLGEDRYRLTGDFTLHGTTRSLTFPVRVSITEDRLEGRGTVRFDQSSFGIEPYSAAFGAVKNQDEVEMIVELVAVRDDSR